MTSWRRRNRPTQDVFIATGALDSLSGRHIDARVDDWRALPDRASEILRDDLLALRLRR